MRKSIMVDKYNFNKLQGFLEFDERIDNFKDDFEIEKHLLTKLANKIKASKINKNKKHSSFVLN